MIMDSPHLLLIFFLLLTSTFIVSNSSSTLDPKQLTALQSMGLPTKLDPCNNSLKDLTFCDSSSPYRHLMSLTLKNCSSDLEISATALHSLSTLKSLSLINCHVPQINKHPLPSPFAASLLSFSCVSSLKHLSGVWLSRLKNLTQLTVVSVPILASGPFVFVSQMPHLKSLTVSNCNLSGKIPHHWHSPRLGYLDFSSNRLKGAVPSSINVLESLETLNLSSNVLSGTLPNTIGELVLLKNVSFSKNSISGSVPDSMKGLSELTHLDLSSNQFNGSVPRFLAEMKRLKYLNLEYNNFQGVMPFNSSFIKRLEVFKVGGNGNLCYNHSLISSKLKLGIAPCDNSTKSDYDDNGENEEDGNGSRKSYKHHHGPDELLLGVTIVLSCVVFSAIFLVCKIKV